MNSILTRFFAPSAIPELLKPGLYHWKTPDDEPIQYRLHLRIEDEGMGVLIVNAATVLHLNETATEHAYLLIQGTSEEEAAQIISERYRISRKRALKDHREFRDQIETLATNPEVDPVMFLDFERKEPLDVTPSAPYRMDLALTYRCDESGAVDPLAKRRVDRELTTEEWKTILNTIWEAGVPHVTFTGGEPTLRHDLRELIAHAETLGQVTGLLTDGKRLAKSAYLEGLAQAGLDHILVAIDLADPKSETGLKNALASDVFTAVHLTITPKNAASLNEHLEKIAKLGVMAMSLSASDRSEVMAAALSEAREYIAILGMDLIWDLPAPHSATNPLVLELEIQPEAVGQSNLYVEPDGDVLPAQGFEKAIGNLLTDPFESIWPIQT
jgi:MoaA/NifB/PqqE/SkfB family radical SAM enzyme